MKITNFENYISEREKRKMCKEVAEKIHEKRKAGHKYAIGEMKELAERFLR